MNIFTRKQIEKALSIPKVLAEVERGFILYSQKKAVVPPIGSMHFSSPPGDCHIKYGYIQNAPYYIVKIASGFPENPKLGIPSGNGLLLLFDQKTGKPVSIFLDEGYLTDIRTAAAGCIAAKYLAPKEVSCIGIIGTGAQAFYQLQLLRYVTNCRKVMIWGRTASKAQQFKKDPKLQEWNIEIVKTIEELASSCNLIVTTTSSHLPLLLEKHIKPGTHITAIGADDVGKQELDPKIFSKAQKVIVDSKSQCKQFGDVSFALQQYLLSENNLIELGEVITNPSRGRILEDEITVASLTGIAIQDLQIATAVLNNL
ncbi:MAG: deaminase [Chlamydiota bacterium]|jgi:ornithine cyclodeaminase